MKQILLLFACIALMSLNSPAATHTQDSAENSLLKTIATAFKIHAGSNEGQFPTNWSMLQTVLKPRMWYDEELKFREFGENKGFTNSIYEKYVFVPPGVKMPAIYKGAPPQGDILFMAAAPYQSANSDVLLRSVIHRRDGTNVIPTPYVEERIQKLFQEHGVAIPSADPMSSAIDPEIVRAERDFVNKANEDWYRAHPEDRPFLRGTSAPGPYVGSNRPSPEPHSLSAATTEVPPRPPRRWLSIAVFAGLGGIAFLLVRASRRKGKT